MHPWSRWYKSSTYRKPLTAAPFDQEGKLIWSDIASSTMALPYGQDAFWGFSIRVWPIEEKITTSLGRKPWFPSLCGILIFTKPVFVRLPRYLGWPIPVFMRVCGHSNKWSWMSATGFKYSVYGGSEVVWYRNDTYFISFFCWITERNPNAKP